MLRAELSLAIKTPVYASRDFTEARVGALLASGGDVEASLVNTDKSEKRL